MSDSWLTCSINGSCLVTIYTCFMYDNRKYVNVNSFIGHSVVLQYVTVHRVEHLTCQNLSERKLDAMTSYICKLICDVTTATSVTKSCGKH